MVLILTKAKPFLKWAGGKGQLIEQIDSYLPLELKTGKIKRYIEPFIGGGALFFHIAQSYEVEELVINDVNEELVLAYTSIKNDCDCLISLLKEMESHYFALSPVEQQDYFYQFREQFNLSRSAIDFNQFEDNWIKRTAQIIFLNRTCFNGLFRVNAKGGFNVPFGKYKNPTICAEENLKAIANILARTTILLGDYTQCQDYVDSNTFVYFDPPYRPLNKTSSFTSYSTFAFNDSEQLRLASFYKALHDQNALLMLSNSDPKNENPLENFFEEAYSSFKIERVKASRMINSNAEKRGAIDELLIMNY